MDDISIKVENLTKIYRLYHNPVDRLKESLHPLRKKYHREFYALDDLSFDIKKGESFGILGKNGSGKSTLLKIITGVLTPSRGGVTANGRVSALLELGAGFNPEMTGLENIYFNGALLGYSKEEMEHKVAGILAFADIGEFAYQQVKTYSSGMFVRLAFGVAITVDPDILIIDEALSVGDVRFQQKCMAKIKAFAAQKTVIFVSHDTHAITELCDRVLWLDGGKLRLIGAPKYVSEKYLEYMYSATAEKSLVKETASSAVVSRAESDFSEINPHCRQFGDGRADIVGVKLTTARGDRPILYSGEWVELKLLVRVSSPVERPIFGFILKDRLGREIFGDNSHLMGVLIEPLKLNRCHEVSFRFATWPNLYPGEYSLGFAIADGSFEDHQQCHWIHDGLIITSVPARLPGGLFSELQTTISCLEVN